MAFTVKKTKDIKDDRIEQLEKKINRIEAVVDCMQEAMECAQEELQQFDTFTEKNKEEIEKLNERLSHYENIKVISDNHAMNYQINLAEKEDKLIELIIKIIKLYDSP